MTTQTTGQPDAAVPPRRPSPRPRPTVTENPNLVTEGNSEVGSSELQDSPGPRKAGSRATKTRKSEVTQRSDLSGRLNAFLDRFAAYWTPPSVLTDPPPSWAELAAYARAGAWTKRRSGFRRACGVWWYRLVALPLAARYRYAEWVFARPGRALPIVALIKLLSFTTWGSWAVAHLIEPGVRLALWLFL